jgi:hypothetical protein
MTEGCPVQHVIAFHTVETGEGDYTNDLFFYILNDGSDEVLVRLAKMGTCTRSGKLFCIPSNDHHKRDGTVYLSDVLDIVFGSETRSPSDRFVPIPGVEAIIVDAMLIVTVPIDDDVESVIVFAE